MTTLRILRNLAVLVIFAVAVLASTPRPVAAAEPECLPAGKSCTPKGTPHCCSGLKCEQLTTGAFACIDPLHL